MLTQSDKVVADAVQTQHRYATNIERMLNKDKIAETKQLLGDDLSRFIKKKDGYIAEIKVVCRANCIDYDELTEYLKGKLDGY